MIRRSLRVIALWLALGVLWLGAPLIAAAGLALDHPAWSNPDRPAASVITDETSYWPPGRRYVWTTNGPMTRHSAVDPCRTPWWGHGWTATIAVVGALVTKGIGTGHWSLKWRRGHHEAAGTVVGNTDPGGTDDRR